jgi:hypothetical protein
VTVNCAERGLLLLRVRDEIRMTIAAYQTLYESSIAFGMRKALLAEQRKGELQTKVSLPSPARVPLVPSPPPPARARARARRSTCVRSPRHITHALPLSSNHAMCLFDLIIDRLFPLPIQLKILTAEVADLERQASVLSAKCDDAAAEEKARTAALDEKHQVEVGKLKATNDSFKEQLDALLAPPKK